MMADMLVNGKLVVVDNHLFENAHHLSLLKDDLVEFRGDRAVQIYSSATDELTLCMWKGSTLRSTPVEGGRLVTANILQNSLAVIMPETLETPPVTSTVHSRANTKFVTVFCSAHFCSAFGLFDQEHVVLRLCTNVPVIERVVLGVRTDDAFRWASGESFRTELRAILFRQTLLCGEGCNFSIHLCCFTQDFLTGFWDQLHVVNCVPVCQGRITEASEIVVKCYPEQHDPPHSCKNSSHVDDTAKAVMVSDFAADIANNCSLLASLKLDIYLSTGTLHTSSRTHELNFMVLKDIERMKYFVGLQQPQITSDELSVAVLNRHCASRLGIMNGNMLELLCKSHEHQSLAVRLSETRHHACRRKVVIACVNTTYSGDDMVACVSSCAWFNLCSMSCMSLFGNCDIQSCYVKVCLMLFYSIILPLRNASRAVTLAR